MKTLVKIRHHCDDRLEENLVDIRFYGTDTYEDIKEQVYCQYCDTNPMVFIPTGGDTPYPIHQHPNTPIIDVVDIESVD
jgi:hypothetical protein